MIMPKLYLKILFVENIKADQEVMGIISLYETSLSKTLVQDSNDFLLFVVS